MRLELQKLKHYSIVAAMGAMSLSAHAQRISVKTNALYWAVATPNIGAEFRLNRHFTLGIEGLANKLKVGSKLNSRVVAVTPEVRYWFSIRPQAGHFVGLMGMGTDYDVTLKNKVYKGTAIGGGVTYGYSFVLGRHWSLEATAGVGRLHVRDLNHAAYEAEPKETKSSIKFAPLKLGVSFVYIIK